MNITWLGFVTVALAGAMLYFTLVVIPRDAHATAADEYITIEIPTELVDTCVAKIEVTSFTYEHINTVSEKDTLAVLAKDWSTDWSKNPTIKHATYVDMQRIVRDAYRRQEKGRINSETRTTRSDTELINCIGYGF